MTRVKGTINGASVDAMKAEESGMKMWTQKGGLATHNGHGMREEREKVNHVEPDCRFCSAIRAGPTPGNTRVSGGYASACGRTAEPVIRLDVYTAEVDVDE